MEMRSNRHCPSLWLFRLFLQAFDRAGDASTRAGRLARGQTHRCEGFERRKTWTDPLVLRVVWAGRVRDEEAKRNPSHCQKHLVQRRTKKTRKRPRQNSQLPSTIVSNGIWLPSFLESYQVLKQAADASAIEGRCAANCSCKTDVGLDNTFTMRTCSTLWAKGHPCFFRCLRKPCKKLH